jgi:pimeloyl-ACP methyl ester carboxylesterase
LLWRKHRLTERRETVVDGDVVHYHVAGRGAPLLLLHGLGGSSRCWRPSLPFLAEHRRIYLVDLPGFGIMRRLHRRFVLRDASEWLSRFLDAVGLSSVDVVGHSMGGLIAARLASAAPSVVDRLVLVAPAGVPSARSLFHHAIGLRRTIRHLTATSLLVTVPDALRNRPRFIVRVTRTLLVEDVRADLDRITAPTLIVWGRDDPLLPIEHAAVFEAGIRGARVLILDHAGHLPMVSRPRAFAESVLKFFASAS